MGVHKISMGKFWILLQETFTMKSTFATVSFRYFYDKVFSKMILSEIVCLKKFMLRNIFESSYEWLIPS